MEDSFECASFFQKCSRRYRFGLQVYGCRIRLFKHTANIFKLDHIASKISNSAESTLGSLMDSCSSNKRLIAFKRTANIFKLVHIASAISNSAESTLSSSMYSRSSNKRLIIKYVEPHVVVVLSICRFFSVFFFFFQQGQNFRRSKLGNYMANFCQ